jgi:hypothetical protein
MEPHQTVRDVRVSHEMLVLCPNVQVMSNASISSVWTTQSKSRYWFTAPQSPEDIAENPWLVQQVPIMVVGNAPQLKGSTWVTVAVVVVVVGDLMRVKVSAIMFAILVR